MDRSKLEIGPGENRIDPSWLTMDREPRDIVDIVCRWGAEKIPLPNESMELVYASHVLEHVPWYQTLFALRDVWRILRPFGRLEIHVPDLDVLIRAVQEERCLDDHAEHGVNRELNWMHWVAERLFHMAPEAQWHRACFNPSHLTWCFQQSGFGEIQRLESERGSDHGIVNLGMSAIKVPTRVDS